MMLFMDVAFLRLLLLPHLVLRKEGVVAAAEETRSKGSAMNKQIIV